MKIGLLFVGPEANPSIMTKVTFAIMKTFCRLQMGFVLSFEGANSIKTALRTCNLRSVFVSSFFVLVHFSIFVLSTLRSKAKQDQGYSDPKARNG